MGKSDLDVVVGVYRLLSQDDDIVLLFYKELRGICKSGTPYPFGRLQFLGF